VRRLCIDACSHQIYPFIHSGVYDCVATKSHELLYALCKVRQLNNRDCIHRRGSIKLHSELQCSPSNLLPSAVLFAAVQVIFLQITYTGRYNLLHLFRGFKMRWGTHTEQDLWVSTMFQDHYRHSPPRKLVVNEGLGHRLHANFLLSKFFRQNQLWGLPNNSHFFQVILTVILYFSILLHWGIILIF
jgi:hypothetical protein